MANTYDDYPASVPSLIAASTGSGSWSGPSRGLKTVTASASVNADGTVTEGGATTVWLYDSKERPVWVVTEYSAGGSTVASVSSQYAYDSFGRMTSDGIEGTDICYNHLDLPRKISVAGGITKANYCYLADGDYFGDCHPGISAITTHFD